MEELHLFTTPTAINLDAKPGPDGFEARLYASPRLHAHGSTITQDSLELLMFDGVVSPERIDTETPLRIWQFKPNDLRKYATDTSLGVGYRFALNWEDSVPTQSSITLVARLRPASGGAIYSAPSVITLAAK